MSSEEAWCNFFWAAGLTAVLITLIAGTTGCQKNRDTLMIQSGHQFSRDTGWSHPPEAKPRPGKVEQ